MLKTLKIAGAVVLGVLIVGAGSGCKKSVDRGAEGETARQVHDALTAAADAYKAGRYAEAEQHARRALQLDPNSTKAALFVARSTHSQFRPGNDSPENVAIAERALAAYREILGKDPDNDEGYGAVVILLKALHRNDEQRQLVLSRAENGKLTPEKRSEAYVVLASQDWDCSFQITETSENKRVTGDTIVWIKPASDADFTKAKACAARGLEAAERAIQLGPQNEAAWSYKANLLLESAKLAEMGGDTVQKAALRQQAVQAHERYAELNRRHPSGDPNSPAPTPPPPSR